jgi:hypothetical protein
VERVAVAGVHVLDGVGHPVEDGPDALDEALAGLAGVVRPAEAPVVERAVVGDDDVAAEQAGVADERHVVVGVARGVDDLAVLVADGDGVPVVQSVGTTRVVAVGVQVGVERVEHGVEFADVVAVLVGEHDRVQIVGVLADHVDDAVHRPGVDEHVPLADREVRVAGERLRVGRDVDDFHARVVGRHRQNGSDAGAGRRPSHVR